MPDSSKTDSPAGPGEAKSSSGLGLENILKIIGSLVAVVTVVWSIANSLITAGINADTARIAALNAERESRKPNVDNIIRIYTETIRETGKIASAANEVATKTTGI